MMIFVLTWAIVGGTATFYGPIIGCIVLTILNEIVLREMGFEQMRPLIYGLLLICSVLFLPKGLESVVQKALASRTSRSRTRSITMSQEAMSSGSRGALLMPVPIWLSDTDRMSSVVWSATKGD